MIAWDVFLFDVEIDTVWFYAGMGEWDVKHSLIMHDGYDPFIRVKEAE